MTFIRLSITRSISLLKQYKFYAFLDETLINIPLSSGEGKTYAVKNAVDESEKKVMNVSQVKDASKTVH